MVSIHIYCFVLWTLFLCSNTHPLDDLLDHYNSHDRVKRQLPTGGSESCLQIYSVPRKAVVCEPSEEVRDALKELRNKAAEATGAIDALGGRIDDIDPDKPKELPAEVKERLDTIDGVKQTQAGHAEFLKRLESEIAHVIGKTYSCM